MRQISVSNEAGSFQYKPSRRCVRTGCVTCRIRKVKCDEAQPYCMRCTRTGRKCDGYSNLPFSRGDFLAARLYEDTELVSGSANGRRLTPSVAGWLLQYAPQALTSMHGHEFKETMLHRCLTFFRTRTVPSSNLLLDCQFWSDVILQACRTHSTIRLLAAAIGALHAHDPDSTDEHLAAKQLRFASECYQEALSEARSLINDKSTKKKEEILVICLMFSMYAAMRSDIDCYDLHLVHGLNMVQENLDPIEPLSSKSRAIMTLLRRLDSARLCAAAAGWGYPQDLRHRSFRIHSTLYGPVEFHGIAGARSVLVDLISQYTSIKTDLALAHQQSDLASIRHAVSKETDLAAKLQIWHHQYCTTLKNVKQSLTPPLITLYMWWLNCDLATKLSSWGPESRWDAAQSCMEQICMLAQQALAGMNTIADTRGQSVSLDVGCIPSLYFVATKCRHPRIRAKAIRILRASNRREGHLDSREAAAIASRWQKIEESGLGGVSEPSDIAENRRVKSIDVVRGRGQRVLSLRITSASYNNDHTQHVSWEEELEVMTSKAHFVDKLSNA